MITIKRPMPGDYPAYHEVYLRAAQGDTLSEAFHLAGAEAWSTLAIIPSNRYDHRYADGKWTIREVYQHIIDTERVFSYRALCIARNDHADLPGMAEDAYQAEARAGSRKMANLMVEWDAVHRSTIHLFDSFDELALSCRGSAKGKPFTVPALGWIIAGHAMHHLHIIRERYLA